MALLLAACLLLAVSPTTASDCDLGASDVIFLVKASHLMQIQDFYNTKSLMKSFSETLDIGRDNTSTHAGVIFFDNIGPPQTRIPLTAYNRISDLHMAIDNLALLPCGSDWCKEKETTFRPALDYTMSRFPKGRMKKIVLIHSGREEPSVAGEIADLTSKDPWLRVLHIFIKGETVKVDDKEATYLTGYHEPYKRYASRMSQLYPNISISIPPVQLPPRVPKAVEQGRITVSSSDNLLKLNDEVCQQLFSCPPCGGMVGGRDPFDKETPLHNKLPENWKQTGNLAKKVNSGMTEDYEYEITGDPPGLKINTNPASKNVRQRQTTSSEIADYVYEDSVPDSRGVKRSKRAVMSPRQRDCTCPVSKTPVSFNIDATEEKESKPAEGCTGGSSMTQGGGCGGTSTAPIQYYPYYYQPQAIAYYSQQQQEQSQVYYQNPCRNPCQSTNLYYVNSAQYSQQSPCSFIRSPCGANYQFQQSQQRYPQYYYPTYYGYYYTQTVQPQQSPPSTDAYPTPPSVLPSLDSIHEGISQTSTKEEGKNKFDPAIFERLSKYEKEIDNESKPTDPFNAKAFGGQLKRIRGDGFFESLLTPAPPAIEEILGKFPEPVGEEENEAIIPARPVTLKPIDIGSSLSSIEDTTENNRRK